MSLVIIVGLGLIYFVNMFVIHSVSQLSSYVPSEPKISSDADLYAWAGWVYVTEGNLATVNPDHPPLAKYLIGVGILLFHNRVYMSVIFGFALVLMVYFLGCMTGLPANFAVTASVILIFDKLFIRLASTSMLDIFVSFFIYCTTLVFFASLKRERLFILYGFLGGSAIACKWSALFFLIPLSIFGYIKTRSKWLLGGMLLFLGTYWAVYTAFFLQGGTLGDFIKLQIFMLENQQRFRVLLSGVPQLLLNFLIGYSLHYNITGQFLLVRVADQNSFTWPLIFSSGVLGLVYYFKDRNFSHFVVNLLFWCGLIPLIFIKGFIWYLLPLLPAGLLSLMFIFRGYLAENGQNRLPGNVLLGALILVALLASYIPLPTEIYL